MIEQKYVKHENKKYFYKIGFTNVNEILQHNVGKTYPEFVEMGDKEKMYRYVEYDFYYPNPVVEQILKAGKIKDTVYKKIWTSKQGTSKFKVVLDSFNT